MSRNNKKIEKIFNKLLKKNSNLKEINMQNCKNWDSLNHIKIILEIEKIFKIKIKPKDVVKLTSFKKIVKFLN